ncbi:MAG: hypothetical protein K2F65_06590 [Eubacterium sp.]|nr:hypothetical protein [Eubacterium sp.]
MNEQTISTEFNQLKKLIKEFDKSALIYVVSPIGIGLKTFAHTFEDIIKCHTQSGRRVYMCTEYIPSDPEELKCKCLTCLGFGDVIQNVDVLMFLHRDEFTTENMENRDPNITKLIIAKNRYGKTGTIKLKYNVKLNCFTELQS